MEKVNFRIALPDDIQAKRKAAVENLVHDLDTLAFINQYSLTKDDIEKNLSLFIERMEAQQRCLNCHSIADCTMTSPGFRPVLVVEDGVIDRHLQKCDKSSSAVHKSRRKNFILSNLEPGEIQGSITDICSQYSKPWLEEPLKASINQSQGVFLWGDPEISRACFTALAIHYANVLSSKVSFVKVNHVYKELQEARCNGLYKKKLSCLLSAMKKADILFLCNLTLCEPQSWFCHEFLAPLIAFRNKANFKTYAAAQGDTESLILRYATDHSPVSFSIASTMIRMLEQMTVKCNI